MYSANMHTRLVTQVYFSFFLFSDLIFLLAIGTTSPLGKAANLPFDVTSVVRFFGRNNLTILDFLISLQGCEYSSFYRKKLIF
jgi:hypothetical protein